MLCRMRAANKVLGVLATDNIHQVHIPFEGLWKPWDLNDITKLNFEVTVKPIYMN